MNNCLFSWCFFPVKTLTKSYFFNHVLCSLGVWVPLPVTQDVPFSSVLGQQDQGPGSVQISHCAIFWMILSGSRRTQADFVICRSLVPSRKENLHCGVAAADKWRILAKLRCFNNRWWRTGISFYPSPVWRAPPCATLCCLPRSVIAQPCTVPLPGTCLGLSAGLQGTQEWTVSYSIDWDIKQIRTYICKYCSCPSVSPCPSHSQMSNSWRQKPSCARTPPEPSLLLRTSSLRSHAFINIFGLQEAKWPWEEAGTELPRTDTVLHPSWVTWIAAIPRSTRTKFGSRCLWNPRVFSQQWLKENFSIIFHLHVLSLQGKHASLELERT